MMECAGELGARFALAQIPDHDRKRAIDSFATLCELAAPHDLVVGLEFLPWGPTDDLAAAVEIVMGAAQPNGGIVVDTLHFCRSTSTVDQIRVLPPSLFPYVQLCDAPRYTPFTDEGLIHTAREARYFPGEAGLELRPLVQALPRVPVHAGDSQRTDAIRPGHRGVRPTGAGDLPPVPRPQRRDPGGLM